MDKPRLLFFRWIHDNLPGFILRHIEEQTRCLERWFEVTVVGEDGDYAEFCDRHRPDLVVFETGVYTRRHRITNLGAYQQIPRLGFIHSDAYCLSRSASIADMERYGVEAIFTMSASLAEYTPEIADRLFVWPNFVDPELYRDYGMPKSTPVLFTGSQAIHYPWRNAVSRVVGQSYPTLTAPHAGWFDRQRSSRMVHGEPYARMINSAQFVPACGTIAKEVVRKHLEIPAARTCLIAEPTAGLAAAGFVDMQNVVFADEHDVLDKLDHLFANPDELQRITDAGHALVHDRHTAAHRAQFRQWYDLRKNLRPGERIVQPGPFQALTVTTGTEGNHHPTSFGRDRVLLAQGDEKLLSGDHQAAREFYLRCLNFHFMAEPVLRLAWTALALGEPDRAAHWLDQTIEGSLITHNALEPDPVEWAFLIRTLLCRGKADEAARQAGEFPGLNHPELDRVRAVARLLANGDRLALPADGKNRRASLHPLPDKALPEWLAEFAAHLTACGQQRLADLLRERTGAFTTAPVTLAPKAPEQPGSPSVRLRLRLSSTRLRRKVEYRLRQRSAPAPLTGLAAVVRDLAQHEQLASVLYAGPAHWPHRQHLVDGLADNPGRPPLAAVANLSEVDRHAVAYDMVVMVGGGEAAAIPGSVRDAGLVLIEGLNSEPGYRIAAEYADDPWYLLVAHEPEAGYAVFRRAARLEEPA